MSPPSSFRRRSARVTRRRGCLLLLFAGGARAAPPLPSCAPFSTTGGQPVACALELLAGYTYLVFTECSTVKGDTSLTLRDLNGVDVAFNECALPQHWAAQGLTRLLPSGFPFCPGDSGASRVDFFFECGAYGESATFSLLQSCYQDTACSGHSLVALSDIGQGAAGLLRTIPAASLACLPTTHAVSLPPTPPPRLFACTPPGPQCSALGDLYWATNGPSWKDNSGWAEAAAGVPTPYTSFARVGIDADYRNVASLILYGNGLSGTLPESLGDFPNMDIIYLGINAITGSIPASISRLTRLRQLWLFSNEMSGALPTLPTSVEDLDLHLNKFSSTLPDSLGACVKLTYLGLDSNALSGQMPTSAAALIRLQNLRLAGSGLCGPVPCGHQPDDGPLPPCPANRSLAG